jgi:broad specificity phosphatase PhoE
VENKIAEQRQAGMNQAGQVEQYGFPSLSVFLNDLNENCLLLARHGETDWNAMKIIQGQQDRPLNATGRIQSENLRSLLDSVSLNRVCCSTLQRTISTAAPISEQRNLLLEKIPELNEIRLGVFEGQPKENIPDDEASRRYQSFLADEVNAVPPGGGESLKMVDERICGVLANCIDTALLEGHVLVVGHRNVNKMIIKNLLGLSLEQGYAVEHLNSWLYVFTPENARLFLIKVQSPEDRIRVQSGYERVSVYAE